VIEKWWVRPSADAVEIRRLLNQDRGYAAYALGDLSSDLWAHSRWHVAGRESEPEALILLFDRLEPPVLFCFGPAEGVAALIAQVPLPKRVYFAGLAGHAAVAVPRLRFGDQTRMWRMIITQEEFRPAACAGQHDGVQARRLTMDDLPALQRLYAHGGADAFAPYQLQQGVFFGCWQEDELVAVAGTHLVAPTEGVAAVGNVFTHPTYRRRGLGAIVTRAVTAELLARGLDVVLNVAQDNAPAIPLYRSLGYRYHCPFIEGVAET